MAIALTSTVTATVIAPKVLIISMFAPEASAWHTHFPLSGLGNLSAISLPLPGLSVLFPSVLCTADTSICHATVGEGEINAAASATALLLAPALDLRASYVLLAGIAGAHPGRATLGSVAFARYAVQVGLQYEVDAREAPADWGSGYVAYGTDRPLQYPRVVYGSEVFELNANLRDRAYELAASATTLDDASEARALRALYPARSAAAGPPALVRCDVTTSDVYFVGDALAEAFDKTTRVWTNGTGAYCMSAQEDNAILQVLVRAAVARRVDFARVLVLRAGANFDRPPPGMPVGNFMAQPGQAIAAQNVYRAGIRVVQGIVRGWDATFARGVAADNYIGDIFGSLGGEPDFGTPATRLDAQRHKAGEQRQRKRWVQRDRQAEPAAAQYQERQKRRNWQERREATIVANDRT
ncbi:Purine nucleoside permease [Cordyceps militaris]|uniref:Purine nucleoside permease n=1 Tax=Cordyceps militaris TaxID=73501 RepID=A0A2H4S5F7_CORMI|nr:Purine nucleoside permease [Cordyceps militaris]